MTNVARHASATKVEISLKEKRGKVILKIRDNGKGITEEQLHSPKSFGLMIMGERTRFLDGEVNIRGINSKGTTILVSILTNIKNAT